MAPPFTVSIRSGNLGSWKSATYQDLRICRQCFSAARKHSGCGTFMITSRSNGRRCWAAKHQATIAPQSPSQHNALGVCGVNQRHHVVQKMRQSVVCDLCRPDGAPVSALINGPDAIAHSREHWYLV